MITTYYYIGDRLVFMRKGAAMPANLRFVSQDHLTSTSLTTNDNGNTVMASIKYFPFGATRAATGTLETDIKFTGQRLDSGVDLYYYGARYYDAGIGRFISADTVVPHHDAQRPPRLFPPGCPTLMRWPQYPLLPLQRQRDNSRRAVFHSDPEHRLASVAERSNTTTFPFGGDGAE